MGIPADEPAESLAALVCLPGGTYDKRYWHLEIERHPGYSFGEHLARAGYIVIAVDHLAVGDSTDPIASGPSALNCWQQATLTWPARSESVCSTAISLTGWRR